MKYGKLPGVDELVSRCVLGTSGIRNERGHKLLDRFMEAGGTCIDTARVYGGGTSEAAVGDWIRSSKPDNFVIIAKGAHPPDCTPSAVAPDLTQTLDLLGVPRVDVYLLHRDDPAIPVGEFVEALEAEVAAGRICAYGASNWGRERLAEANRYAVARGGTGMIVLSNHFSLAEPVEPLYPGCEGVSPAYLDMLADGNIALMPWSSQARGFFANVPESSLDPNVWRCWGTPDNYARRERAAILAERRGVDTINIALAYVLNQPFGTYPIIGPQTVEELETALVGVDITMDADELRWLREGRLGTCAPLR
ncbi:aldo/keto reductase [Sphaerisporangium fuscum]|uniref:aldo/keto reductase n=1 Tax=Sphaerisporangium fuscum TaxID=2835868 RepID=UPI001BDBBC16|nr:aldo/keto reductase [Sphaerisporangium fuscum]